MTDRTDRLLGRFSHRAAAMLVGVFAGAAVLGGCSTTTTPASTTSSTAVTSSDTPSGPNASPAPETSPGPPSQDQAIPSDSVAPQPITSVPATTSQQPVTGRPAPGTTFTGEGLTAAQAADLQTAVNGGHQPWRLDRVQVAKSFVQNRFGWTSVQTSTGAPMVVFVTNQDGGKVALHLVQPATQGDHGIWMVDSGVWS
ncbi:hypothetical protein KO481_15955 [Nocardia sp. NEAU-G5]|uniref:Lipoprotein n=1 Tax=Nocardia albiluteola TaxID=2842303 RepID=A0ABS6B1B3_9NOCA|nr:hypothetical protein [Nocardia albiluteola]MBU3063013.1 hypothetical protein [Nocardia albiluteola]